MTYENFMLLHDKLHPKLDELLMKKSLIKKEKAKMQYNQQSSYFLKIPSSPPPVHNGHIDTKIRLACAIRYFAGRSQLDIMVKYGISLTENQWQYMVNC